MTRTALPLASFGVLRTEDVDLARSAISASLAPHRLRLVRGDEGFRARHNSVDLGGVGLHVLDYGAETEVVVEPMDRHLVQVPLGGRTAVDAGDGEVVAGVGAAALTPVGRPLRMRYSAGNPRVVVEVPAGLLRERAALAGVPVPARTGPVDLTRGAGRSWRALVDLVLAEAERPGGLLSGAVTRRSLGLAVVDGLLAGPLAVAAGPPPGDGSSAALARRAVRLVEEHCAEPLGTADVAEALGVPVRTLQAAFRTHLGSTPSAHLRRARLDRVRAALLDGSAATVTEAAQRWGVPHLGRLAADYRQAFGETPAETLRRAR